MYAPTTHDVEFAARIMVEQKGSIEELKTTQGHKLIKLVTEFEHLNAQIQEGRSRNSIGYIKGEELIQIKRRS